MSPPHTQPSAQEIESFIDAAAEGGQEIVAAFLDKYPAFVDVEKPTGDDHGFTALAIAAWKGHKDTTELLLARGANPDKKIRSDKTALMYAAARAENDIIELLLDRGASIDEIDKHGYTALTTAASMAQQDTDTIRLLLDRGADIDARGDGTFTALMWAAVRGHLGMINLLLERDAGLEQKDRSGDTALALAKSYHMPEAAAVLEDWPHKKQRDLARDIADFSPALKRPMTAPRKLQRRQLSR